MSKLQEKSSELKREHPALQKFINFFLCLWIVFALLDLDPIESGSNPDTDPDPQHCLIFYIRYRT
jgi:hypothetical protein